MWWIVLGVVAVILLRQVVPIFTSVVAMALIIAVAIWAYVAYRSGASIAFAGEFALPEILVYGLLLVWFGLEAKTLAREIRLRDLSKKLSGEADESP